MTNGIEHGIARAESWRRIVFALSLVIAALSLAAAVHADQPAEQPRSEAAAAAPSAAEQVAGQLLAPKAFRAAVAKVLPSIVTIETFGGVAGARRGKIQGISRPGDGPTTGVIVSSDGYVITSTFNFLRRPPVITVVRQDGRRHVAMLLGRDETRKLCILKIADAEQLPVPEFVDPSALKVGAWAISVGVGYGDDDPVISAGIVSGLNRVSGRAIQTDANISPANYGGPLVDIDGRVIGICVPLNPQSQDTAAGVEWYDSGIGFAVPLFGAEKLLADLKAGKTIQSGSLGVQVKPAEASGSGATVVKVLPDSAAAKAGLQPNDRILRVGGEEVLDVVHLRVLIGRAAAGEEVTLDIRRGEDEQQVKAVLQLPPAQPPAQKKAAPADAKPAPAEGKPAEAQPAEQAAE